MNNVSPLPSVDERNDKRRLHLREVVLNSDDRVASIGAVLRAARLERGQEIAAVASALKMRREQVDAIEQDDFARLPGNAYTLGFIRSYARHVGLDSDALVRRFKDESADQTVGKPVELVFPEAPEEKRLPNASILILALVIAMVIYGISYVTMPDRKTPTAASAEEAPIVVVETAAAPVAAAPTATAPEKPAATTAAIEAPASVEPAATPTTFIVGYTNLPGPSLPAAIAPMPLAPLDAQAGSLSSTALTPSSATIVLAEATPAPVHAGSRITLTAIEPTYVRMRDPRVVGPKAIILDRVLNTGESFYVPDRPGLIMQTGNAGGLQVAVDGRLIGVLGKRGEVVTRIPVDPSYFLERLSASQ
ncbi:MAG: DUF4115 domain-containing protein [Alphaproteobacteria bacterium]|nr:DUF4115 domain-containing protein [Alphaproteobacteria bacterium]